MLAICVRPIKILNEVDGRYTDSYYKHGTKFPFVVFCNEKNIVEVMESFDTAICLIYRLILSMLLEISSHRDSAGHSPRYVCNEFKP